MRHLSLLLRVQLLALLNSLSPASRKDKAPSRARVFWTGFGWVALGVILIVYVALYAVGLALFGAAEALPVLAVGLGSLAGVVFTFMKANGTLFGFADYDLTMSLPVSRRCVVASRMAALFLTATVFGALLMAPMLVVYFVFAGASAWGVVCAVLAMLLAPAAPTSVAVLLAFLLTLVASRFRHANLVYVVFALVALVAFMVASYAFSFSMRGAGDAGVQAMAGASQTVSQGLAALYPPAGWVASAIVSGEVAPMVPFILVSIMFPAVCLEALQRRYLEVNSLLASHGGHALAGDVAVRRAGRTTTPFQALVRKELQTVLGYPMYAVNCLLGYVIIILGAAALVVLGAREALEAAMVAEGITDPVALEAAAGQLFSLIPWAFAFFAVVAPSAAIAVSMEGKGAWVMATLPVDARTVLRAKLFANAGPMVGLLVAAAVVLLVAGELTALEALGVVLGGFGPFWLFVNLAMRMDVRRPNYAWTSAQEVVKRSGPIMLCVIGGMLCVLALGGVALWLSLSFGATISQLWTIVAGVATIAAGTFVHLRTVRTATLLLD